MKEEESLKILETIKKCGDEFIDVIPSAVKVSKYIVICQASLDCNDYDYLFYQAMVK